MAKSMSHLIGKKSTPLLQQSIGQNLKDTVEKFARNLALIDVQQQVRLTYQEFWEETTKVAKSLMQRGLKKGDRLGICTPNRSDWTIAQYASARIGVILVNLNPAYRETELEFVINDAGIKMMISVQAFKTSNYNVMFDALEKKCPVLEQVLYIDTDWNDFLQEGEGIPDEQLSALEASIHQDEAINIQYTSGTTGFPKGVTLTHSNILNNGFFIGERLHYTEIDTVCIPVPLFHCFGMVIGNLACTTHGATMVYPAETFEPLATLKAVETEQCTSLYGVPTMFIAELQVLKEEAVNLSSLRTGVMAGSPCPEAIMKIVKDQMNMSEITVCYGMTETSPVSTQSNIGDPLDKQVGTVGTPMDHLEMKIINPETGDVVERMTEGEICTKGYSVMKGYWNNPSATNEVLDQDGWMHSGDLGYMDEDGYVVVSGRLKDLIIRGGENVSPREIEEFLYTHECIADVQVIGVPDVKYGEEIMAWVKIKPGKSIDEEALKVFCKGKIAHYKIPRYWKFVDQYPMTVSGKVRKVEMKEIAIKELGL